MSPSGMGKTALVERFVRELERGGRTLVLRSRCHPQESLPYKALDGIVDDLSRVPTLDDLAKQPLPEHIAALLRLFPVLRSAPRLANIRDDDDSIEPVIRRRHGARALRELLAQICAATRLLLWIDDLQWGTPTAWCCCASSCDLPTPPRSP
jgi:hypothetical protein